MSSSSTAAAATVIAAVAAAAAAVIVAAAAAATAAEAAVSTAAFHQCVCFRGKCLTVADTLSSQLREEDRIAKARLLTSHRLALLNKGAELKGYPYPIRA